MYLNDIRGRHVKAEHVLAAIERASAGLVEEGNVLNSLCRAQTLVGRDGRVRHALPLERLVDIMHRFGQAQVHLP